MSHSYQLTKYQVGTKREFFALSWPLMLGLISSSLMMFVDRLFLAQYDPMALTAAATGGVAYYTFFIIAMGIVAISEVLAGRLHGENNWKEIGSSTWQMVFVSLGSLPLFCLLGWLMPQLLFHGSGNEANETTFFRILIMFAPAACSYIALSGFFMGIGDVKKVTYSALAGNAINIVLDYWFIFGAGPIPSMGIAGAVLATGLSQVFQALFLLYFFLSKYNRETYHTHKFRFNKTYLYEGIRIGAPSGIGYFLECCAHFIFFRIVMSVGHDQMTVVTISQSFYMLAYFVTGAFNKSASAIVSNLIGAKVYDLSNKVLRSAFTIHSFFFLIFLGIVICGSDSLLLLFSSEEHKELLSNPQIRQSFMTSMILLAFFFLIDGWVWILVGFLTAAGDTKYILVISAFVHWVLYLLPTLYFVGYLKGGAEVAWGVVLMMNCLNLAFYVHRYFSGKWLNNSTSLKDDQKIQVAV